MFNGLQGALICASQDAIKRDTNIVSPVRKRDVCHIAMAIHSQRAMVLHWEFNMPCGQFDVE